MSPHDGLVHLKEYDIKDSNVELIGTDIDHRVKYNSAATEPAWNDGHVGAEPGLFIWRIEDFQVVAWPKDKYGKFYDGDSFIVLHTVKVGGHDGQPERLAHDIFFWLGAHTSQDEAGVAAYKTVELDEFLRGVAVQHREVQAEPSDAFLALFPHLTILRGGVRSGFRHVEAGEAEAKPEVKMLLRIYKVDHAHAEGHARSGAVVHEVEPTWRSLDDNDVFVLDVGDKIWVWQGKGASPMAKAKAAQVVNDLTLAKHIDVEVVSQAESRSHCVVDLLGGGADGGPSFRAPRQVAAHHGPAAGSSPRPKKLFRLSDTSGRLEFGEVKEGQGVGMDDLHSHDVFLLDTGAALWVWEGSGASRAEKAAWLKVAQAYVRDNSDGTVHLLPIAKVVEGNESADFRKAIAV